MPGYSISTATLAIGAVLAAAAAGCGTARAGSTEVARAPHSAELPRPDRSAPPSALEFAPDRPFYVPGERMRWNVTWMGVTGGVAGLAVGEPGQIDGRPVLVVRSESRSEGLMARLREVHDQSFTKLDLESAQPLAFEGDVVFGERSSRIVTTFAPPRVSFQYQRAGRREIRWTQRLPSGSTIHNLHSAIGALRAWRPKRGEKASFYAVSGRRLYRIDLEARGSDNVDTPLGRLPTLRIHGTAQRLLRSLADDPRRKPRVFDVWVTDDVNRLPVWVKGHTEYGDVEVSLVDYKR